MPRERKPEVGRPFNAPVTVAQQNAAYQTNANVNAISVDPPMTITNTPGGGIRLGIVMPRQVRQPVDIPITTKQFKLADTRESDAFQCVAFDGGEVTDFERIWVARPWFIRGGRTWSAVTRQDVRYTNYIAGHQQRRATKDGEIETQTIVPRYATSDIIIAVKVDTGVLVPGTEEDEEPETVEWLDINNDGRMWQVVPG